MNTPVIRHLGLAEYVPAFEAMKAFTEARTENTPDEIWICEHPPVYTVGLAGREEHYPKQGTPSARIPVVKIDRGGQITYHGPGQVVVYTLLDMQRCGIRVKELVRRIEQAVIDTLDGYNVVVNRRDGAPGVYLGNTGNGAKIAALGLRIRRHCCYHGVSLNVDMDLTPFSWIDPCGFPGLDVTQTKDLGIADKFDAVAEKLVANLIRLIQMEPAAS